MINYHISEVLSEIQHQDKSGSDQGEKLMNDYEQKMHRNEISQSLLKEKWMPEATNLFEKSKQNGDIHEFFRAELEILTHNKSISNHRRHRRFIQMIDKV